MDGEVISLKDVYDQKPYSDHMRKLCAIRDEEMSGDAENSVMNMVLILLKKINRIYADVLEWIPEHYYPDWRIMKIVLCFVKKEEKIAWFCILGQIMEKWKENRSYITLGLGECWKAYENCIDIGQMQTLIAASRMPHDFALAVNDALNRKKQPLDNTQKSDELAFYKERCRAQQAEIDCLSKYKMQQDMISMYREGTEKQKDSEDEDLIRRQKERIQSLEGIVSELQEKIEKQKKELESFYRKQEKADAYPSERKMDVFPVSSKKPSDPHPPDMEKKKPVFLSGVKAVIRQRAFERLPEIRQREFILKEAVKAPAYDLEYVKILKKLLESRKVGLPFLYKLLKEGICKEEMQSILILLEDEDNASDAETEWKEDEEKQEAVPDCFEDEEKEYEDGED